MVDDFCVLSGQAEITDVGIGTTYNLDVVGRRDTDSASFHLKSSPYAVHAYPGSIDVSITSETESFVRGDWKSSIGAHGTFRAVRKVLPEPSPESLIKKNQEANVAFIMMAFENRATGSLPIVDICSALKRGCDGAKIPAHRANEIEHSGSITSLIIQRIRSSRFLISDLTHERPNVYYEIGYAHGLAKEVILTAQKGTVLYFNIASFNVIFYERRSGKGWEHSLGNEAARADRNTARSSCFRTMAQIRL
jgi:hypothetical protein